MERTKKLKVYRNNSGLTQESLANKSGISIRTIQRIEKGLSSGSPYTLKKLAEILKLENWELLIEDNVQNYDKENIGIVKSMNLSSLAVLIIPLSNFIFPLILFFKAKERTNLQGRKILSFQFLWVLITLVLMILLPLMSLLIFDSLKAMKIPLFAVVYFLSVAVNIYLIVKTAINLNERKDILTFVPKIF